MLLFFTLNKWKQTKMFDSDIIFNPIKKKEKEYTKNTS